MLFLENILLALSGLKTNMMRTLLTMLGIIIGIASVIAIMTVGDSISGSVTSSMESIGANNITVSVSRKETTDEVTSTGIVFEGVSRSSSMSDEDYISDEMIDSFRTEYNDSIQSIYLSESVGSGTAEKADLSSSVSVTGVNADYLENEELNILSGRGFTDRDFEEGRKLVLVADDVADTLFDGDYDSAVGSSMDVFINNRYYTYTVIGVYENEEDSTLLATDDASYEIPTTVYLPLNAAREETHSSQGFSQITVTAATGVDSAEFCSAIESYFNSRYYRNNDSYEISASSMESMLSSMTEMISTISTAIAVIAGISLLVGGIGVMNIMLVSITERTREIGTRKALGATNNSIRLQFIVESIVICMIGGAIGIILGISIAAVATNMLGFAVTPSVSGIVLSVSFSAFIGIFFGYYPANKAAKLNPIEALRYE